MSSQLKRYLLVAACAAAGLAAGASASASPALAPSRADGSGLWDAEDNPALIGCMDPGAMRLGAAYGLTQSGSAAPAYVGLATPFGSYLGFSSAGAAYDVTLGAGFPVAPGFILGYKLGWSSVTSSISDFALGAVFRPADFVSLGIAGSSENGAEKLGIGLGLRPLALLGIGGKALTITADADFDRTLAFAMENVGARLSLGGLFDLRGWYEFPTALAATGGFGASVLVTLGPTALGAAAPKVESFPASGATALASFALEPSGMGGAGEKGGAPFAPPLAKKVLLLKGLDLIDASPRPESPFGFSLAEKERLSFPELVAELDRAAADPCVVAVAIEKLPPLQGIASYQELDSSLAAVKAAGKKIYVYGEAFGDELAWLSARAESVSLNPNGSAALTGLGYRRTYLKPLFDSIGVKFVNLAPWSTKSAYNSYTADEMPPEERDMMKRFYGDIQDQVEAALAMGRGSKLPSGAQAALEGGPYLSAADALKAGLVDSLSYEEEFEGAVKKACPGAVLVPSLGGKNDDNWGEPAFAKRVAVVWLEGSIGVGKGVAGASIGSLAAKSIAALREDGSVAAIVLRVDSPGGAVITSDDIAREVRLAVAAGKPVVVSMGSYAASGGYYVSANASRIFAEPATITGSIGVTGLIPNFAGTLAKLGLKYEGVDISPNASFVDPLKPVDPADEAKLKAWILATYDRFVDVVAEGRRMDRAKVLALGEGRIWSGREAVANGLVDELGGLREAKAYVAKKLGKAVFFDVLPGEAPSLFDGIGLQSAAKGKGLAKVLEPLEARIEGLAELGSGPLYYLDLDSF